MPLPPAGYTEMGLCGQGLTMLPPKLYGGESWDKVKMPVIPDIWLRKHIAMGEQGITLVHGSWCFLLKPIMSQVTIPSHWSPLGPQSYVEQWLWDICEAGAMIKLSGTSEPLACFLEHDKQGGIRKTIKDASQLRVSIFATSPHCMLLVQRWGLESQEFKALP